MIWSWFKSNRTQRLVAVSTTCGWARASSKLVTSMKCVRMVLLYPSPIHGRKLKRWMYSWRLLASVSYIDNVTLMFFSGQIKHSKCAKFFGRQLGRKHQVAMVYDHYTIIKAAVPHLRTTAIHKTAEFWPVTQMISIIAWEVEMTVIMLESSHVKFCNYFCKFLFGFRKLTVKTLLTHC